jgi:hypothetical protein
VPAKSSADDGGVLRCISQSVSQSKSHSSGVVAEVVDEDGAQRVRLRAVRRQNVVAQPEPVDRLAHQAVERTTVASGVVVQLLTHGVVPAVQRTCGRPTRDQACDRRRDQTRKARRAGGVTTGRQRDRSGAKARHADSNKPQRLGSSAVAAVGASVGVAVRLLHRCARTHLGVRVPPFHVT